MLLRGYSAGDTGRTQPNPVAWLFFHFGCGFGDACFLRCLPAQICLGVNDSSGALCVLCNLGGLSICFVPMCGGHLVKDFGFSFLGGEDKRRSFP